MLLAPLAGVLPAPEAQAPDRDRREGELLVLAPLASGRSDGGPAGTVTDDPLKARVAWLARRESLLAEASRPAPATSPSRLEQLDEDGRGEEAATTLGRSRALARGAAVHRVMELCDLADASSVPALAGSAVRELGWPDLESSVSALAGVCWRSAPVRAAAASHEVHRELPVGALVDGAVVSGAVDLLYREGAEWVVVDFKTDADADADAAVLRERYTLQGAAYALCVEAATGGVVREVVFVAAARGGEAVAVPVGGGLRALARQAVSGAAHEGRVVGDDVHEDAHT